MSKKYYAHSLPGRPKEEWQPLEDHLRKVAEMARGFAEPFGGGDWAYLAGLWQYRGYIYLVNLKIYWILR